MLVRGESDQLRNVWPDRLGRQYVIIYWRGACRGNMEHESAALIGHQHLMRSALLVVAISVFGCAHGRLSARRWSSFVDDSPCCPLLQPTATLDSAQNAIEVLLDYRTWPRRGLARQCPAASLDLHEHQPSHRPIACDGNRD